MYTKIKQLIEELLFLLGIFVISFYLTSLGEKAGVLGVLIFAFALSGFYKLIALVYQVAKEYFTTKGS